MTIEMRRGATWLLLALCVLLAACGRRDGAPGRGGRLGDEDSLKPVADVPPFRLSDQNGEPVTLAAMRGKVWIGQVFLVCCPGKCPDAMRGLKEVYGKFAEREDFHVLSVTANPQEETTKSLRTHADAWELDDSRWHLVRGTKEEVHAFVQDGLRIGNDPNKPEDHSFHVALIDRAGRIRNYYRSLDADSLRDLERDARWLLAEKEVP